MFCTKRSSITFCGLSGFQPWNAHSRFSKSEFILETPEFGAVRVETSKNMFMDREEELRTAVGKPVDIALDKTGKELSLAVHQGQGVSVLFDKLTRPPVRLA